MMSAPKSRTAVCAEIAIMLALTATGVYCLSLFTDLTDSWKYPAPPPTLYPPYIEMYDIDAPLTIVLMHGEYSRVGNMDGLYWVGVPAEHLNITICAKGHYCSCETIETDCYGLARTNFAYMSGQELLLIDSHGCNISVTVPQFDEHSVDAMDFTMWLNIGEPPNGVLHINDTYDGGVTDFGGGFVPPTDLPHPTLEGLD